MRGIAVDGNTLRKWRKEQGVTQEQFAGKVPCDIKTIRNAEKGSRLDASTVKRIADAMEQPLATIVVREDDAQRIAGRNAQLFHDWQAAHNIRDVEALVRFYHDAGAVVIPGADDLPGGGQYRGKDAIRRHFTEAFAAFDTEKLGPDRYKVDAVGDYVFVRGTASAVVRATRQRFTATAIHELEIRDGKIFRHTIVVDTSGMRRCFPGETPRE